jgi:hypothetical protein
MQRQCQFVREGRENRHDDDRLGRPTLDFIDFKIITVLDRESFHSAYALADAIGVSHSTIFCHVQNSFGMKKLSSSIGPILIDRGSLPKTNRNL